jgi:GTP-binding protein Era
MVDVAQKTLSEADVVLLVLDATAGVTGADEQLAQDLAAARRTTIAVPNKLDRIRPPDLLPIMDRLGRLLPGRDVIPTSARTGDNVPALLDAVVAALPEGPRLYPDDEYTTETERFLVQELIREQVFLQTEEEVPYGTAVLVEEFSEKPEKDLVVLRAVILVERPSHKGIVIGAKGQRLREVGRRARLELEALLGVKVFLELFVRVEPGWSHDPRRLKELGL